MEFVRARSRLEHKRIHKQQHSIPKNEEKW